MNEGRKKYGADNVHYLHRNFIADDLSDLEFAYSLSNGVILDNGCFPYECTITILKDRECTENGMVFDHFMRRHRQKFEDGIFVVKKKAV